MATAYILRGEIPTYIVEAVEHHVTPCPKLNKQTNIVSQITFLCTILDRVLILMGFLLQNMYSEPLKLPEDLFLSTSLLDFLDY